MKRFPVLLGLALATSPLVPLTARAETPKQEKTAHPNIAHAIDALDAAIREGVSDPYQLQQTVRRVVGRWVNRELRRRPMIIPVVIEA